MGTSATKKRGKKQGSCSQKNDRLQQGISLQEKN